MTGILTSAVSFGGGPSGPVTGATATYNGTAWTAQTATLNDTRSRLGGAGETDSSSVAFGGFAPNGTVNTELWDGSSWTEVGNMGTARYALAGTGTKSSALGSGGYTSGRLSATEEWNISISTTTAAAWASGGALNTARSNGMGAGTQTAGLMAGGRKPAAANESEEYDGTSWTEGNNLNTARYNTSARGPQTAAIGFGGYSTGVDDATEEYDGTSWTNGGDLNNARTFIGAAGNSSAALGFGGYNSGAKNQVESYDGSSWTNGTAIGTARYSACYGGTQTAAIIAGGNIYPTNNTVTNSEEWNGSAWSEGNDMITKRAQMGPAGNQTDIIAWGGIDPGGPTGYYAITEGYDGTSWSTRPSLSAGRERNTGSGTGTLGLAMGGSASGPDINTVEEFTGETTSLNLKTITDS
jgi:hypothetical protein